MDPWWNPAKLRLKFSVDFTYHRHHHRLESWNIYFLQPLYLQRYADAVAAKGAPLYNYFDLEQLLLFVDLF